jgi:hypothetical protein
LAAVKRLTQFGCWVPTLTFLSNSGPTVCTFNFPRRLRGNTRTSFAFFFKVRAKIEFEAMPYQPFHPADTTKMRGPYFVIACFLFAYAMWLNPDGRRHRLGVLPSNIPTMSATV